MPQTLKPSSRVSDMTKGEPVKLILAFAIPLFIGNIFQQIYSMVDTMVAGYFLGDSAIAAIGATSSLYSLLLNLAIGMNNGYAIVVTQCFGAHDEKRLRQSVAGMILLNAAVTLTVTLFSLAFLEQLMHFMNTPESIFSPAYQYIWIICAGMLATIAYNMFAGFMRAMGNSQTPLYFLIFSSALNIALDLLMVVVFQMGVAGAALATVVSQAVSAILSGFYVARHYRNIFPTREDFRVPKAMLGDLLTSGIAMGLMLCVVDLGSVIYQRANNDLGETIITAHTAVRKLFALTCQPLGGIATSVSTFVGQNWGAKQPERIRYAMKRAVWMELAWCAFIAGVIFAFGGVLVRFTTGTSDPAVIANAVMGLRWNVSFYPALGILLCLRTSMQAMGRKAAPIISSVVELLIKAAAARWIIPALGYFGTCITEPIAWVAMMLLLAVAYFAWRRKLPAETNMPEVSA